jgi:hypothetical protein
MPEAPIDDRRFTDEEVREILKKAVEKAPSRALAKTEGLSLAELKTIGGEVGIDPARLEEAARALTRTGGNKPNMIFGAPTVHSFERKVEGEFDPDDTPEILSVIRRTMSQQGEVEEIRGSLEWSGKGEASQSYVTLSSREGTTTIQGSTNLTGVAFLTYVVPGFLGFIPTLVGLLRFIKDGSIPGLVVCLTVLPILYPILRTLFKKISGSESAKLQQVVDELAQLTEGSGD